MGKAKTPTKKRRKRRNCFAERAKQRLCVVTGCPTKSSSLTTFHCAPNNVKFRKDWEQLLGVQLYKCALVCARHFSIDCYRIEANGTGKRRLLRGAKPTAWSGCVKEQEENTIPKKPPKLPANEIPPLPKPKILITKRHVNDNALKVAPAVVDDEFWQVPISKECEVISSGSRIPQDDCWRDIESDPDYSLWLDQEVTTVKLEPAFDWNPESTDDESDDSSHHEAEGRTSLKISGTRGENSCCVAGCKSNRRSKDVQWYSICSCHLAEDFPLQNADKEPRKRRRKGNSSRPSRFLILASGQIKILPGN